MKYVTSYSLLHMHTVRVGVEAESEEEASKKVHDMLDEGTLHSSPESAVVLSDDFEEEDGQVLEITAERVQTFPAPDSSACELAEIPLLRSACRQLIAAYKAGEESEEVDWEDVDLAHEIALMAKAKGGAF